MDATENTTVRSQTGPLIAVLIAAVAIRLLYQAGMVWYGGSFSNGSDSNTYLTAARELFNTGVLMGSDRLPLYIYFLAGIYKAIGFESVRAIVTVQAFIDALTILAIALSAKAFSPRLVLPAAVTAAILPNLIVHASYVLQENVFLLFLSWGLCALLWALKRDRPAMLLVAAGVLFGLTLWTRLTFTYLPVFLVPALFVALRLQRHLPWLRCALLALIPAITMAAVVSPLLIHNYLTYGHAALSSQPGEHMLYWLYGCLASPWPCADRKAVGEALHPIIDEYIRSGGPGGRNAFDVDAFQKKLAMERILQLPLWQIAWGITWGSVRNVFQTGFYAVLAQFNQPAAFLSAMPGGTILERAMAFVRLNATNGFMILWVISQVSLLLSRVIQAMGAFQGLKRPEFRGGVILLLTVVAYTLALNGPFADPKYRIPCEPSFVVLFALGLAYSPWLSRRWPHRLQ